MKRVLVGAILIAAVLVGVGTLAQGPALPPGEYDLEEGQYVFNVPALDATDTAPVPTDTAEPPTETPVPPTATSPPGHNDRAWHTDLGNNHEHKADPHTWDAIFGTQIYDWAGGEISYPWQTPNENLNKHGGYGWLGYSGEGCISSQTDNCIKAYRFQYHGIFQALGATVRYHSYWLEALVCTEADPDVCGIARTGGWVDFGCLMVDGNHVPLPGDPPGNGCFGPRREHRSQPGHGELPVGGENSATWYGARAWGEIALLSHRIWGSVNPDDPFEMRFFCENNVCGNDGSKIEPHIVIINTGNLPDPGGDGYIDFNGWTDRHGNIVQNCDAPALDCIPLIFENVPRGYTQYRDDGHGREGTYDGRTQPIGTIQFPN